MQFDGYRALIVYGLSWLVTVTFFVDGLVTTWTVVPPSTNPSSRLNQDLIVTLRALDGVTCQNVDKGRIWLEVIDPSALKTIDARSVRFVLLQSSNLTESDATTTSILASLCGHDFRKNLSTSIDVWEEAGNRIPGKMEDITFCIQGKKWDGFLDPCQSTTTLVNGMATRISNEFGWQRVKKAQNPTFQFHLLLYNSTVVLEMIVLVRTIAAEELPKPGFKRVESFVVAKAADIQPNQVILDPMCGKGTFLVEAATFWPEATYFGVDTSTEQLQDATLNCKAAKVNVTLRSGDATRLRHIPDSSVDRILCCPPFGRQFDKASSRFYVDLLSAWSRVLADGGMMVLLIDLNNVQELRDAVAASGCWVAFQRSEFWLGKIKATFLIVRKCAPGADNLSTQLGLFDWEVGNLKGRAQWASLRSQALPKLSPIQTK